MHISFICRKLYKLDTNYVKFKVAVSSIVFSHFSEKPSSSDGDGNISNDSPGQEMPMRAEARSVSNQSRGLPEKPTSSEPVVNLEHSPKEVGKEGHPICKVPALHESSKNGAGDSAKQVSRKDDSSPTLEQHICKSPSPTGGTNNVVGGGAKENDPSPVSTQNVDEEPFLTECAKNVADDRAKQVLREDDLSPISKQDVGERRSSSGSTRNGVSTESAENVGGDNAKQVLREDDLSPISKQNVGEKPSSTRGSRIDVDGNAKEKDSSPIWTQGVSEKPSSTGVARESNSCTTSRQDAMKKASSSKDTTIVADGSFTQFSEGVHSSQTSKQTVRDKQTSSGSSGRSVKYDAPLQTEDISRSKDDSKNGSNFQITLLALCISLN